MAKAATLTVKIVSDAKGAAQGFEDASSRVDKFKSGLDKASVAAGGVLGGLALVAKGAFDAASALQQSTGGINTVFGDWAIDIEQAAQKAATAVGLATSDYENSAALIGAQLNSMGFNIADNVAQTQR
jgi:CubicO group peptidase (beta-lactamase class C family)